MNREEESEKLVETKKDIKPYLVRRLGLLGNKTSANGDHLTENPVLNTRINPPFGQLGGRSQWLMNGFDWLFRLSMGFDSNVGMASEVKLRPSPKICLTFPLGVNVRNILELVLWLSHKIWLWVKVRIHR